MDFLGPFRPRAALSDEERAGGLRAMTWQAVSASAADGFASGGFLAAFALAMGANNTQIGIMAALPFLMQPLQVLALVVVERTGTRKAVAVGGILLRLLGMGTRGADPLRPVGAARGSCDPTPGSCRRPGRGLGVRRHELE